MSQRDISKEFKIPLGTPNSILKNKQEIERVNNTNENSKSICNNFKTKAIDMKLFEWFISRRRRFITIQDTNLQEMAIKMAKSVNIHNFSASNGWLQLFKRRHNICSRVVSGESGLVDSNVIEDFKDHYAEKIRSYRPEDIYNCDETGLFYKCTPTRSLCHVKEVQASGKYSKERVTLLFCVSLSGEKCNPLLIGKAKTPRGFKNLDFNRLGISYKNNNKAWMITEIFCSWLYDLNEEMIKRNKKILLTLDNAPVHPVDVKYSNIELLYFPPNLTSRIQPLDQGIIRSFKSIYRRKLNSKLNFEIDEDDKELFCDLVKKIKMVDALFLILDSWNEVSRETIINCYKKSLENSLLDPKTLLSESIVENDTNTAPCYPDLQTEDEILMELKEGLKSLDLAGAVEEQYFEEEKTDIPNDNINCLISNSRRLTKFEFFEHLSDIELYLGENQPELLSGFYSFKTEIEKKNIKKCTKILDYLRKK
ncbi:Tigger transposable element-derived protein 6 [Dictyocoela muelleri]|nr:Tigger transposable element-derived protein 6 [Dictyocoela muelleri]